MRSTTLDYIILGLIQSQPLSGYRIRKTFEETALGNFGGSPGTIYPALKRLSKNELILKIPVADTVKFQFRITDQGLRLLKAWLSKTPEKEEIQKDVNLLILKFAFMDPLIDRYQKIEYLQQMLIEAQDYLEDLEHFYVHEKEMMSTTGQLSFEYGLLSYTTTINWCQNALERVMHEND